MAAPEQQQDDEEERAALERELAAALAALGDDEDDDGTRSGECDGADDSDRICYERLDLDAVLRSTAAAATTDASKGDSSVRGSVRGSVRDETWTRLLESVAFCEAQVFRAFDAEMDALATHVLPQLAAVAQRVVAQRGGGDVLLDAVAEREASAGGNGPTEASVATVAPIQLVDTGDDSDRGSETTTLQEKEPSAHEAAAADAQRRIVRDERIEEAPEEASRSAPSSASVELRAVESGSERKDAETTSGGVCVEARPSPVDHPRPKPDVPALAAAVVLPPVPSSPPRDAELRLRAQQNAQRAQQEMAAWLEAKQRALEREQLQRETQRREAAREREEATSMAREERKTRLVVDFQCLEQERARMQSEDELSQRAETALAVEIQGQERERALLAAEEARVWRLRRLERDAKRQEQLVEALARERRARARVLDELVAVVRARVEAKRRAEDAERRRALREASDMRHEEHAMRRVLLLERAAREARERRAMGSEDALATAIRARARQQLVTISEQHAMASEEARSRVMETLWRLRVKRLSKWVEADGARRVRWRFGMWRNAVETLKEQEKLLRLEEAARVVQRLWRRWTWRRQREELNEAAQAARVVQSAFRGFHVRRKFQNALDMAQRMAARASGDDADEYGEVDVGEWLEAPPELDDDWERPAVMPAARRAGVEEEEEEEEEEEDEEEEDEDEETVRGETLVVAAQRAATPKRSAVPALEPQDADSGGGGGSNLAAVLWNKMRRRTQRQRQAQDERQRQQDPVYRAQKVLAKPTMAPSAHHTSNQSSHQGGATAATSITWATNADKKKAPKVKLPSLVERLRKKTAAAR